MSRVAFVYRSFRCTKCHGSYADSTKHFRVGFWTAPVCLGKPLSPTYRDLRCPDCHANAAWFEPWPRVCANFILPLREDLRPVVFRWHDRSGKEHYRYPSSTDPTQTADALPRENEERIDFPTLRSMETFLKEQNPNYRDWQQPLNDILDYDEARIDTAINENDPGAAEDAEDIAQVDDHGTLTESEAEQLVAADPSPARALIEKI